MNLKQKQIIGAELIQGKMSKFWQKNVDTFHQSSSSGNTLFAISLYPFLSKVHILYWPFFAKKSKKDFFMFHHVFHLKQFSDKITENFHEKIIVSLQCVNRAKM